MKKILFLTAIVAFFNLYTFAQDNINGFVVLNDGQKLSGSVTEQFRKNKSIQLTNTAGKQSSYSAETVQAAMIGNTNYRSINNEYYETILENSRFLLLEKLTKISSGISYNGNEPIVVPATEGNVNDLFIYLNENNSLQLLTKKNFKKKLVGIFPTCSTQIDQADANAFNKAALTTLLKQLESCK
jgi:hypothetical protein